MERSTSRKTRENTAFLYERISRDDNLEGDSYSVANQKTLLAKAAKEKGYTNLVHFCDDGISGVTMNRPRFNAMIEGLEKGQASAVFVKDLSRLGRNYIEVGKLTEEFFQTMISAWSRFRTASTPTKGKTSLRPSATQAICSLVLPPQTPRKRTLPRPFFKPPSASAVRHGRRKHLRISKKISHHRTS